MPQILSSSRAGTRVCMAVTAALAAAAVISGLPGIARAAAPGWTGLVTNDDTLANTLTPFDTSTNAAGSAIGTGGGGAPSNVVFTTDGTKAYVVELVIGGAGEIIPVDVAGSGFSPQAPVVLPGATSSSLICTSSDLNYFSGPAAIALTPDGSKGFVTDIATDSVYPVNLTVSPVRPERRIRLASGAEPVGIAVTPDGSEALVADMGTDTMTPISTSTDKAGTPIHLPHGSMPFEIAVTPDDSTAYVAALAGALYPIDLATGHVGRRIAIAGAPNGLTITPDGHTAYVTGGGYIPCANLPRGTGAVTPVDLRDDTPEHSFALPSTTSAPALTPDGKTLYVLETGPSSEDVGVAVATNQPGAAFDVGPFVSSQAFAVPHVAPPPPPVLGKSVDAAPVSGVVLVKLPGQHVFTRLQVGERIPLGSTLDTTNGVVTLTAAEDRHGRTTTGRFYAGAFRVTQSRVRAVELTDLALAGRKPAGCNAATAATARKHPRKRSLWGYSSGDYRTEGTYASATERGTKWLTEDSCAGTLIRVNQGAVTVDDFPHHRTFLLTAPHSFFAHRGPGG